KSGNTYTDHFLIYLLNQNLNQYESNTFQTKEVFLPLDVCFDKKVDVGLVFILIKRTIPEKNLSTTKYSDFSNF
ncbi:TPA: hypothetical protein ACV5D9_003018, partial [Enterococcus faecium]